jgi:hypothetical protein
LNGAGELMIVSEAEDDSAYRSHNLVYYYRHDLFKVLGGLLRMLKADDLAVIRAPDIPAVMQAAMDPITVRGPIYGYGRDQCGGNDCYAHVAGYTLKYLHLAGFGSVKRRGDLEIWAVTLRNRPCDYLLGVFGLPADG